MDATPVTLGQEFGGYAAQVGLGAGRRAARAAAGAAELPLGGTAVGTGINTPRRVRRRRSSRRSPRSTGLPLREARNHFEAQGARDALVELSGSCAVVAVGLTKICNDLRWMGSGPRAGLGEIHLPDLQPGSSIMPGKVNPVIPEATLMVCAQVIGNDATITVGRRRSGNFELNVMLPVIGRSLLESLTLLAPPPGCWPTAASTGSRRRGALPGPGRGVAGHRHPAEPLPRLRGRCRGGQAVHRRAPHHPRRGRVGAATSRPASSPRTSSTQALDLLAMARPPR